MPQNNLRIHLAELEKHSLNVPNFRHTPKANPYRNLNPTPAIEIELESSDFDSPVSPQSPQVNDAEVLGTDPLEANMVQVSHQQRNTSWGPQVSQIDSDPVEITTSLGNQVQTQEKRGPTLENNAQREWDPEDFDFDSEDDLILPDPPVHTTIPQHVHSSQQVDIGGAEPMGSLFAEKVGLLEQKIDYLLGLLKQKGTVPDTGEIDKKIERIERSIENGEGLDSELELSNKLSQPETASYQKPKVFNEDPLQRTPINANYNVSEIPSSPLKGHYQDLMGTLGAPIMISSDSEGEEIHEAPAAEMISPYFSNRKRERSPTLDEETQAETCAAGKEQFSWSSQVKSILRNKFGLPRFRPNQLEAVNATLQSKDVIVLMPTGGGKSLCYQLPALASEGLTLVVSPLISLMQDQVQHLKNKNIKAEMLNSKLTSAERHNVNMLLTSGELKLLYVSPEMLNTSTQMRDTLKDLYNANKLARLVIDEAHCVSSWGHDFRPDYKELERLKSEFPHTPIMALTATANQRVLLDIKQCVRGNAVLLTQSFNRANLYYEVRPKASRQEQQIAQVVHVCKRFPRKSGIIYCHSRMSCTETARKLCQNGIMADQYHAGMDSESREKVQEAWSCGKIQVVCATIAFGMGIDKADVRYVVHQTLPRNMEGYYQETGRAGRDGNPSVCVLLYSHKDAISFFSLIDKDQALSREDKEKHRNLLQMVMQYCENNTDCRRKQILHYFNEQFDPSDCHSNCDTCRNLYGKRVIKRDVTMETRTVCELLKHIQKSQVTLLQTVEILQGQRCRKNLNIDTTALPGYGLLSSWGRNNVERLLHHLSSEGFIEEYSVYKAGFARSYIRLSRRANTLLEGRVFLDEIIDSRGQSDSVNSSEPPAKRANHQVRTQRSSQSSTYNRGGGAPRRSSTSGRGRRGSSRGHTRSHNSQSVRSRYVRPMT